MKHLRTLLPFLRRHAIELSAGFVCMFLQNYSFRQAPVAMQQALDEITQANRLEVILPAIGHLLAYTLLMALCMFLMRDLIIGASRKIEYALREQIYHKLLALDMAFFQNNETGDLVSRCSNDLGEVRQLLGPGLMYIPNSLSRLALFLPVLFGLNHTLMLTILGLMVIVVTIIVTMLPRLRPLFQAIQESVGAINSRVWQIVSGITTVKLYSLEPIEIQRFQELNRNYIHRHIRVVTYQSVFWPFFLLLFALTEILILWMGGKQVILQQMTIGQLLQFTVMIALLTFPILSLGWVMSLIQQGMSAMGRINYILEYPVETRADWQTLTTDELVFTAQNLCYTYPEHRQSDSTADASRQSMRDHVLENVSFRFESGQVIGITGTIGSGKTTLVNLLTGLFKPERGMLFVNGIDICDLPSAHLLEKISVVPQEPFLFSRTLAENIALGADGQPDMEEIRHVVRTAGLEREVETFPDQYDQLVGERGITLSGGQKQRTAIARALRKHSPVLIFDDALSSVDARTEAEILEHLEAIDTFKTLIIISHRISALRNADRIYVLDQGHIVEQGTHAELIQLGKLYGRLAKMQQMEMTLERI